MIETVCKDCVFATWSDRVQVACSANGRAEKWGYERRRVDGYTSFVVKDHICPAKRESTWLDSREPLKKLRTELYPKVQLFLFADEKAYLDCDLFEGFAKVNIAVNPDRPLSIYDHLLKDKKFSINYYFRCREQAINSFIDSKCNYYYVDNEVRSKNYYDKLLNKLDNLINDQLKPVFIVSVDGVMLVNSAIHDYLGGNAINEDGDLERGIASKIEEVAAMMGESGIYDKGFLND